MLCFTKLKTALSSVAQSVERIKCIPKCFMIIICQRKDYAKGFTGEMAKPRTDIVVTRSEPTSVR